jgi:hypothetical protein
MSFQTLETDNYLLEKTDALVVEVIPGEHDLGIFFKQFVFLAGYRGINLEHCYQHDWVKEPLVVVETSCLRAKKVFLVAVDDVPLSSTDRFASQKYSYDKIFGLILNKAKELRLKKVLLHALYGHYYHYRSDQIWCGHASLTSASTLCDNPSYGKLDISYAVDTISGLFDHKLSPEEAKNENLLVAFADLRNPANEDEEYCIAEQPVSESLVCNDGAEAATAALSPEYKIIKSKKIVVKNPTIKEWLKSQMPPNGKGLSTSESLYSRFTEEYLRRQTYAPCERAMRKRLHLFLGKNRLSSLRFGKEPEKTELAATALALDLNHMETNEFYEVCSYHPIRINPYDNFLYSSMGQDDYRDDITLLEQDYKLKFGKNFYSGKNGKTIGLTHKKSKTKHKKVSV